MQMLAMLTMLIDHIGLVFYPEDPLWRLIGRIAFPLYCYALVQGYFRTRDIYKYLTRLFVIGLVSQPLYMWGLGADNINVIGTLFVSLTALYLCDKLGHPLLRALLIGGFAVLLTLLPFDYNAYGMLLVVIYRYLQSHAAVAAHLAMNIAYWLYAGWFLQMFSAIATIAIYYWPFLLRRFEEARVPRWMWRSFYPAHMAAIGLWQVLAGIDW